MSDYAIIDVETTEIKNNEIPRTLFWGYANSNGTYERFKTTKALLRFLRTEPNRTILHHSNFDVLQLLVDGAPVQILRSHNSRLIRCKLYNHILLNSYSTFPCSLAEIFKAYGYKKSSLKNLDKRNWEDCVNGLKCFLDLDSVFETLAQVSPLQKGTIAGTAFSAAEKFVGTKMPKNLDFIEAYRGGRVEVFDTNEFPLAHKYDINSSYPYSILQVPNELELLTMEVATRDWYCPFFHKDITDLLLFPNGTFRTYIFADVYETYIRPNISCQTKVNILRRDKFNASWLCKLRDFVARLFQLKRTTSNLAQKICCKFLLNSMYGRMGLRGESQRARILDYRPDGDDVSAYCIGKNRWLIFDTVLREPRSNFPFAAYITDNARGRLYASFVANNAIYGDTDSVISLSQQSDFSAGTMGENCGEWKYEGSDSFRAINVKDYFWGEKEVRKGGEKFLKWTLKQFAKTHSGKAKGAEAVVRTRETELRKREVLKDGKTNPLMVNR